METIGLADQTTFTDDSSSMASDPTYGPYFDQDSTAVLGGDAWWYSSAVSIIRPDMNPYFFWRGQVGAVNTHWFIGICVTPVAPDGIDAAAVSCVGLYVDTATDGNLKWAHNDVTGSPTLVDTGDLCTGLGTIEVIIDVSGAGTAYTVTVQQADGTVLDSRTLSSDLPSTTATLTFEAGVSTVGAAATTILTNKAGWVIRP